MLVTEMDCTPQFNKQPTTSVDRFLEKPIIKLLYVQLSHLTFT